MAAANKIKVMNKTRNIILVPLYDQAADGTKVKTSVLRLMPGSDNVVSQPQWVQALKDKTFREGFLDQGLVAVLG